MHICSKSYLQNENYYYCQNSVYLVSGFPVQLINDTFNTICLFNIKLLYGYDKLKVLLNLFQRLVSKR